MFPAQCQRLLAFLSDARSYPHQPPAVTLVQTHASWVFLAPPFVYKIKKPVKFAFLDFSTLELRHADCLREVELNRRLAGDIYLGVEPVCEIDGTLQFGGEGTVIEWVVKMHQMDQRFFLNELLRSGSVGIREMDHIIDTLYKFYGSESPLAPADAEAATAQSFQNILTNLDYAREHTGRSLSLEAFDAILLYTTKFEHQHRPLLASRVGEGRIRDCHGDLHLEHIHLTPDAVRIYDCIEFNTAFRHIDVACDIAFLAMDLDFNGRFDLSRYIVERFVERLHDDGLKQLMDFYKCYRAAVRGKVESLHSSGDEVGAAERSTSLELARRYFRLALRYALAGSKPHAFVIMGRVASGKSTLAKALGEELGWSVLSSDRIRKTLASVPLCQRGSTTERSALYASDMTEKVYAAMCQQAVELLQRGKGVILDATFSTRVHRDALRSQLDQEGFGVIWAEVSADEAATLERLRGREAAMDVVSDARLDDRQMLDAAYEPPDEVPVQFIITVSTHAKPSVTLRRTMEELARRNASNDDGLWQGHRPKAK